MPKQRDFTAKFLGERHVFDNGNGSRVIIGQVEDPNGVLNGCVITIKGDASEGELKTGLTYRFYGHDTTHRTHGKQFHFASFVAEQPADEDGITAYLEQCQGIGPATAYLLWDEFGPDAVRKLREEPAEACQGIPRFSEKMAEVAAEFLKQFATTEKTKIEVINILNGRGFPKKLIDLVIGHWGSAAAETIRKNPYQLMKFRGCGFLRCDKMFLDLGGKPGRIKRQTLCLWHGIAKLSNGDTWVSLADAKDCLYRNISGAAVKFDRAIELAVRAGILATKTEDGRTWFAEGKKAENESRVSNYLEGARQESLSGFSLWPDIDEIESLSEHQSEELESSLRGMICVLAGRPGTGKTYASAALIRAIISRHGSEGIAVAAPTGKAAVRLTEAMAANEIELQAMTIHRLLKVETGDGGGWTFFHNEETPLPFRFIVIDEASMLDVDLTADLLAARAAGTHVIFVGDPNQLPPVGHGAPLRDFLRSGIPHGELTEIQRNSGQIVKTCAAIVEKKKFPTSSRIDVESGQNIQVAGRYSPEDQIDLLADELIAMQQRWELDPVWDCQVLVAVNKKSPLGRKPLNEKLQGLLNPHGKRAEGNPFRVRDKVICTKNKEFPDAENPGDGLKQFVANGEMGEVVEVESNRTTVRLTAPDRLIIIPRGNGSSDDKDEDAGTGCEWELGYAISVHKSQGSEWPVVFVMLDEYSGAKMVMSRQWIYTAISRAKMFCVCIGKKSTAESCCHRDSLFKRKTFLRELILEPQRLVFDEMFSEVATA